MRTNNSLTQCLSSHLLAITPQQALGWLEEVKRWMLFASHGQPLPPSHDAPRVAAPFDDEPTVQQGEEEALPADHLEQQQEEQVLAS